MNIGPAGAFGFVYLTAIYSEAVFLGIIVAIWIILPSFDDIIIYIIMIIIIVVIRFFLYLKFNKLCIATMTGQKLKSNFFLCY